MNYELKISLEGAEKVEGILDKLSGKSSNIGNMSNAQIDKVIDASGILKSAGQIGEKAGKEFHGKFKKYAIGGVGSGTIMSPLMPQVPDWLKNLPHAAAAAPKVDWKQVVVGMGLGYSNPYVGSRVLSDQLGKLTGGIGGGLFGKGGIAGFSEIFLGFKIFKVAVDSFAKVIENAKTLYAKSLSSGLGLGLVSRRSALASILGVSEVEVIKFGMALNYLNSKIQTSTAILANTATNLASVSWEASIFKLNLSAIGAQMMSVIGGGFSDFLKGLNLFMETLMKTDAVMAIAEVLKFSFVGLSDAMQVVFIAIGGLVEGFQVIADTMTWLMHIINNLIAKIPGAGKLGFKPIDTTHDFDKSVAGANALLAQAQHLWDSNGKISGVPSPQSMMKQLPASTWERMGLVMGGGGNTTNDLIRKSNGYLKTIAHAVTGGVARGRQFGLDPNIANP